MHRNTPFQVENSFFSESPPHTTPIVPTKPSGSAPAFPQNAARFTPLCAEVVVKNTLYVLGPLDKNSWLRPCVFHLQFSLVARHDRARDARRAYASTV